MDKQSGTSLLLEYEWDHVFVIARAVALVVAYWYWRIQRDNVKPVVVAEEEKKTSTTTTTPEKKIGLSESPRDTIDFEESSVTPKEEECEECDAILLPLLHSSTVAERKRFMKAHAGNVNLALPRLQSYLEWREKHLELQEKIAMDPTMGSPSVADEDEDDETIWNRCSMVAKMSNLDETSSKLLPRLARMYKADNDNDFVRDVDGMRLLHVMPGQMDATLAHPDTYALTLALHIDHYLERSSMEQLTVVIDVRGGQGWPNTMPHKQLPFIQSTAKLLLELFPERCHKCIIGPVPFSALWIWNIIKVWLDADTASKVVLLPGPARIHSPPPRLHMQEHMSEKCIDRLENERQMAFLE